MHCMLMDLLHGFEVLSTTEETLFNSRNVSHLVQKTIAWAKNYKKWELDEWEKVLFSDESYFVIGGKNSRCVRRSEGEKANQATLPKR